MDKHFNVIFIYNNISLLKTQYYKMIRKLILLLGISINLHGQTIKPIYVYNTSDIRYIMYQDSLINYKHNEMYKAYVRKRLANSENLGDYINICNELGLGSVETPEEKISKKKDGYFLPDDSKTEKYEIISDLHFCNDNFDRPTQVYFIIIHKPIRPVIVQKRILENVVPASRKVCVKYDTVKTPKVTRVEVYYEHNYQRKLVDKFSVTDSTKSMVKINKEVYTK